MTIATNTIQPWYAPAGVNRGSVPLMDKRMPHALNRFTVSNIAQYDYRFQWEILNRSTCPNWIAIELDSVCSGKWTWRRYVKLETGPFTYAKHVNRVVLSFESNVDLALAKMVIPHDFEMPTKLLMTKYQMCSTLELASAAIHRLRNDTCKIHK